MKRISASRRYDVPAERVFAFVTNTDNWSKFWPGYVRLQPGSRWNASGDEARLVIRLLGRERELTLTLTTFEPNRLVAYTSMSAGSSATRTAWSIASSSNTSHAVGSPGYSTSRCSRVQSGARSNTPSRRSSRSFVAPPLNSAQASSGSDGTRTRALPPRSASELDRKNLIGRSARRDLERRRGSRAEA